MELPSMISTWTECTRLALMLGFKASDIWKWNEATKPLESIAEEILLLWNARTSGTKEGAPSVLGRALLSIGRADLFRTFTDQCAQVNHMVSEPTCTGMGIQMQLCACL